MTRTRSFFAVSVLIFGNHAIADGVYVATLLSLMAAVLSEFETSKRRRSEAIFYILVFWFLGIYSLQCLFGQIEPIEGLQDTLKICIVLYLAAYFFRSSEKVSLSIFKALPWSLTVYLIYVVLFVDWNTYDAIRARFAVPAFGSPNSLAFVLAIALISLQTNFQETRTSNNFLFFSCYCILILSLLATQSRGGMLVYVLSSLSMLRSRLLLYALVVGAFGAVLTALIIPSVVAKIFDYLERGSSGRVEIWLALLDRLLDNPISLLVGNGPVKIVLFESVVDSAHSMMVQVIYGFGLLGIVALVLFGYYLLVATTTFKGRERYSLSILLAVFVSAIIDSVMFNAQLFWLNGLLLGLIASPLNRDSVVVPDSVGALDTKH